MGCWPSDHTLKYTGLEDTRLFCFVIQTTSPFATWLGGFVFWFWVSVVELFHLEAQRDAGFCWDAHKVPARCARAVPKHRYLGEHRCQALGFVSPEGS